jgi:ABC-type sugar transport system ATPase subunit
MQAGYNSLTVEMEVAMTEYILQMTEIYKTFPGVKALQDVDFTVKRGEVHCLIGANGAGKSTLIKILSGAYSKDSGSILFDGQQLKSGSPLLARKAGISVIYQELSLVNELSVIENILINNMPYARLGAINWKQAEKTARALIDKLGVNIDPHAKAGGLSIGSRQLVELMKCLAANSKLIVMDEPSATLSQEEFNTLMRIIAELKQSGMTIVYISHRLEELFTIGDRVTVLKDGKNVITTDIKTISIDQLVEYMIGYKLSQNVYTNAGNACGGESGAEEYLLEVEDFKNSVLNGISLKLRVGDIVGMYGLVGSGRTELLRAIYGVDRLNSGAMKVKGTEFKPKSPRSSIARGIGMLPENRKMQGLVLPLPVWQNIIMVAAKRFRRPLGLDYKHIYSVSKEYINKLDIKTPNEKTDVLSLSGGNQQKIILAKWLLQNSDILLVDEPTQGIDVKAKGEIYRILRDAADSGHGVIIVSSELDELLSVCDRIMVVYHGEIVAEYSKENFDEASILQFAVSGR